MTHPERGLIMVKPHAVQEGLEATVTDLLQDTRALDLLDTDDPLRATVQGITLERSIAMDLRQSHVGNYLLELFYADKSSRRYYPLIRECYTGNVVFIPYTYQGDLSPHTVYTSIKGSTEMFDTHNSRVTRALGIRGALGEPYLYVSNADAAALDDQEYRKLFLPVVNNFIHVCDTTEQIDEARNILENL